MYFVPRIFQNLFNYFSLHPSLFKLRVRLFVFIHVYKIPGVAEMSEYKKKCNSDWMFADTSITLVVGHILGRPPHRRTCSMLLVFTGV